MASILRAANARLASRSRVFSSSSSFAAACAIPQRGFASLPASGVRGAGVSPVGNSRFCGGLLQTRAIVNQVKSTQDFESVTASQAGETPVKVVQFSASWCGPCRHVTPIVEGWSNKMPASEVQFFHVDIDECPELAEEYDISSVPTFLVFKNGKRVNTVVGGNTARLEQAIKESTR
ncbi:thioredoxin-like protein TLP1 [Besnoitia besnoiti]|uniref:Thioredoxin-like protein TLP1 n=1 Tax=Besnoitia besnoiti TaxID=94643 RepID=A0A2A9MCH0_BESBE|nr:thioredoxin-like protein TLP1 [Besnoitia besnoiti]PFH35675.1 thioredoxin-like protein TLP1 [Besnoitia besnoiti]